DDSHPCVIGVAVTAGDGERCRYSNHWYTGIIVTLAPGTLAPTTTTTTWPTTTTTAPAPAVRCPPARVPMWLWRALVALFGFRCGPPATTTTTLRPGQDMVS